MLSHLALPVSRWSQIRSQAASLPRALALVWQAARFRTVLWTALFILQGLLPAATVLLTRIVVDRLVVAFRVQGDWTRLRPVLIPVACMAGIAVLTELLGSLLNWLRALQAELVHEHMKGLIHRQAVAVDMALYEQPEFYDQLHNVSYQAGSRPVEMLESLRGLLQSSVTLVAFGAVLLPYGLWVPAALFVSAVPALWVIARSALRLHHWNLRALSQERRALYYEWILTGREYAAELRLFALGGRFQKAYQGLKKHLRAERLSLARRQSFATFGAGAFGLLVTGGVLVSMVGHGLQGRITLGVLALFYQAFQQGQRLMRDLLAEVGHLYAHSLFLKQLFEFLAIAPQITDAADPVPALHAVRQEIRFHHVTFRYPDSLQPALVDFDLTVPAGQIVALVGANGSGKSTLAKLLCRLYDPEEGQITIDGADLREMPVAAVRRSISALFQDFARYSATVSENITMGCLVDEPDREEIEAAARGAGAHEFIMSLPQNYDTLLGREFEHGTELSGGQWQRIALARVLMRQSPILLLDEPTSALDSWAEEEWLRRFRSLAAGRCAIVITHRFTTAMHADIIHVMDRGQIVESGSHRELLAQNGRYARSWTAQLRNVEEEAALPVEAVCSSSHQ